MPGVRAEAQESGCRISGGQVGGEFITREQLENIPDPIVFPQEPFNRRLRRRRNPGSEAADGACNGAYCPPGSFCRTAPGASGTGLETLGGGGKMNRMSAAIA